VRDKLQLEPRGPGEDCSKLYFWAIEGSLAQQATDDVAGCVTGQLGIEDGTGKKGRKQRGILGGFITMEHTYL